MMKSSLYSHVRIRPDEIELSIWSRRTYQPTLATLCNRFYIFFLYLCFFCHRIEQIMIGQADVKLSSTRNRHQRPNTESKSFSTLHLVWKPICQTLSDCSWIVPFVGTFCASRYRRVADKCAAPNKTLQYNICTALDAKSCTVDGFGLCLPCRVWIGLLTHNRLRKAYLLNRNRAI